MTVGDGQRKQGYNGNLTMYISGTGSRREHRGLQGHQEQQEHHSAARKTGGRSSLSCGGRWEPASCGVYADLGDREAVIGVHEDLQGARDSQALLTGMAGCSGWPGPRKSVLDTARCCAVLYKVHITGRYLPIHLLHSLG
jgi:hypothetical protein